MLTIQKVKFNMHKKCLSDNYEVYWVTQYKGISYIFWRTIAIGKSVSKFQITFS